MLRNLSTLYIVLFFLSISIVEITFVNEAEAGVLFRNRRQVIRTSAPQFQQQNYRVSKSTVALRRTAGSINPHPIGTVDDQAKLIRSYYKYEERLAKWEDKKAKVAKKKRDKELKLAQKEQQRRAKEIARLRKKQEREQKIQDRKLAAAQQQSQQGSISSPASNPGSRGALTATGTAQQGQNQPQKSFWSKLLDALFGSRRSKA